MKFRIAPRLLAALLGVVFTAQLHAQLVADGDTLNVSTATNLAGDLILGTNGGNTMLDIFAPGTVTNVNGTIGLNATSTNNRVRVSDGGAVWNNTGSLYVGDQGTGNQLIVTNGGNVFMTDIRIGNTNSAVGNQAVVAGTNSLLAGSGGLFVGYDAPSNSLVIADGAIVAKNFTSIGFHSASSSNNWVTVTGPGSLSTNGAGFTVGGIGGGNHLVVSNGAVVASVIGWISGGSGSMAGYSDNNTALITGSGSSWNNSGDFNIGGSGTDNQLVISNGATVADSNGHLGNRSANNTALITSPGSLWTNSSVLTIGYYEGDNHLVVSNGAIVASRSGFLGSSFSDTNTALITGPGSLWTNSASLAVGDGGGYNQLIVSNGAVVASAVGYLGGLLHSTNNTALITGPGSLWTNSSDLYVGYSGGGNQLVVSNGAVVANNFGYIGNYNTTISTKNTALVTGPGSLWTNSSDLYVGYSSSGNQLVVSVGAEVVAASVTVGGGNAFFSINNLLRLDNGTLSAPGGITVQSGNTLAGSGIINGVVTIASGATISPGASIGTLILSNSPALQGNVVMEISKTGATLTNDLIQVLDSLTYGGTLTVSNLGPDTLAAGDSFKLFSATSYTGAFSSLNLPTLPGSLMWTNRLLLDGSLAIVPLTPPTISSVTESGTNLEFNVTDGSPGGACTLLTSTNVALPLSNWTTNSIGNFDWMGNLTLTNAIDPATPQRFFTLRSP